jgi:hypothetical protein
LLKFNAETDFMDRLLTITLIMAALLPGKLAGQADSSYAFCNLFYLSTDHHGLLPVDSICFLNDNYKIINYRRMRVIGPIKDQKDFFKDYDFSFTFHMPEITGETRLVIQGSQDLLNPEQNVSPGKFFFTISDNRERRAYGPGADEVDFASVSGKVKITEFRPKDENTNHPQFNAQFDAYMQKVDRSGPLPQLVGPMIRLQGVLEVENKREF